MKKFTFRLDSVLRYRETQLQLERARLTALLADEARLRTQLENVRNDRGQASSEMQNATEFQVIELRALSAYLISSSQQMHALEEQLARRAPIVAAQRERVLVAERNVRLLEKLREQRLADWRKSYDREMDATAEENWLARFA